MGVISLYGRHKTEFTVEKSRFITYAAHTEGEEEARAFVASVRAEHPLATHVCYAFVADKIGNLQRFSDDGEPSGTAGMPILDVIKKQKLFETSVAVVRYFGGVKLGAGGLVRAYTAGAVQTLSSAEKREYLLCTELSVTVSYGEIDAVRRFLSARNCEVKDILYGEDVRFLVAIKAEERSSWTAALVDFLNDRAEISEKSSYFCPFPLANGK